MNAHSIALHDSKTQDVIDFAKFIGGLLEGAAVEVKLGDITGCIKDVEEAVAELKQIMADLKKETVADVEAAVKEFGKFVASIPAMLNTCEAIPEDIKKLESMAISFSNPISFIFHAGKNLILNGVEIFKEVSHAEVNYDDGNYFDCGYYSGEALGAVFLKGTYNYRN